MGGLLIKDHYCEFTCSCQKVGFVNNIVFCVFLTPVGDGCVKIEITSFHRWVKNPPRTHLLKMEHLCYILAGGLFYMAFPECSSTDRANQADRSTSSHCQEWSLHKKFLFFLIQKSPPRIGYRLGSRYYRYAGLFLEKFFYLFTQNSNPYSCRGLIPTEVGVSIPAPAGTIVLA